MRSEERKRSGRRKRNGPEILQSSSIGRLAACFSFPRNKKGRISEGRSGVEMARWLSEGVGPVPPAIVKLGLLSPLRLLRDDVRRTAPVSSDRSSCSHCRTQEKKKKQVEQFQRHCEIPHTKKRKEKKKEQLPFHSYACEYPCLTLLSLQQMRHVRVRVYECELNGPFFLFH